MGGDSSPGLEHSDQPCPPLVSIPPLTWAREGLCPSGHSVCRLGRGQPAPALCGAGDAGRMSPGPRLTLCTERPGQPLTCTVSPLSPPHALCSLSACHHLPRDIVASVRVHLPTQCQLQEDGPFPVPSELSPGLGQLPVHSGHSALCIVDTLDVL